LAFGPGSGPFIFGLAFLLPVIGPSMTDVLLVDMESSCTALIDR
jgi:hypothetical protein